MLFTAIKVIKNNLQKVLAGIMALQFLVQIIISSIVLVLSSSLVQAEPNFFEIKEPPRVQEFIYRSAPKESLIAVQLVGAVKFPGMYYIPPQTDLLKLMALAGGIEDADLTSVLVRKTDPAQPGVYELNLEKLMKTTSEVKPFRLTQDDFIYIPKKEPWISNDVSRSVTIVSLIATIILTSVLIEKNSK